MHVHRVLSAKVFKRSLRFNSNGPLKPPEKPLASEGPSKNKVPFWASDDGQLWSVLTSKTGGILLVFRGFLATKAGADGRQLTPRKALYFWTGPKDPSGATFYKKAQV